LTRERIRVAVLVTVATGALLATGALGTEQQARLAVYAYLLFLGVLAGRALLRLTISSLPPPAPSALEAAVRRQPPPDRDIAEAEKLRQLVYLAEHSEFEFHYRLRPLLREVAAARLARRRGLDLDGDEAAAALLGDEAWEMLRPDRPPADDKLARGPEEDQFERLIGRIEAL
jgi:hypothetical protein